MISHTYLKDEEHLANESLFNRISNSFIKSITILSYYAGERTYVSKAFAYACIILTYLSFFGTVCYGVTYQGLINELVTFCISISNITIFLTQNNIHSLLVYIFFFLNLVYVFFLIIIYSKLKSLKKSHFIILLVRYYQLFNILNYWIFLNCELEISLIFIIGNFPQYNSIVKYFSVFNIIISILVSLLYSYYGNKTEFNFEVCDYLSRLDSRSEIILLIVKILFSGNFSISYCYPTYGINYYLSINLIISIIVFWYFTSYSFYYYEEINILFLYSNLILLWTVFSNFIISNFQGLGDLYIMIILGFIFLYPISKYSFHFYLEWVISKIPFVELKEGHILCKYMSIIISLICKENLQDSKKLLFLGIIKQHELNCVYDKCICKMKDGLELIIPKNEVIYQKSSENFGFNISKVYFLHLVKNIFEFLIVVTRTNNINLIIMFAYFMYFYIGNYYYSLFVLITLSKKSNINLQQFTSMNRIFEMINSKVEEINLNPITKITNDNKMITFKLDLTRLINFYDKITTLRTNISFAVDYSMNFWNCILNKVEIEVIKQNGLEFYKHHSTIEQTFKEINLIYDKLEEINNLYYSYKTHVFGDIKKFGFHYSTSSLIDTDKDKFFNTKSTIVIANLTDKNKAIIEKISENVKTFLGYNPSECLGQDVKLLMPTFFKLRHTSFINNHFDSGVSKTRNKERQFFALHSKGYSIPTNMILKMLPQLGSSIYFVGFLRELNIDHDFIITTPKGKIEMVSKGIFFDVIKNSHLFGNIDYYIHFICKEYLDEIGNIFDNKYSIEKLLNSNKKSEFNYSLMHFKNESQIEKILKEFKKNDNNKNHQGLDTTQNAIQVPISKIISSKEIKNNFKKDCIKKFTILIEYPIIKGESLLMFKLYTQINTDLIFNVEEMQLVENYLQNKESNYNNEDIDSDIKNLISEDKIALKFQASSSRKVIGFNYNALEKVKYYNSKSNNEKKQKQLELESGSNTSLTSSVSMDYYKQYQSIMKRYSSRNTYDEITYIIILNVLFLIGILFLIIQNYTSNYLEILNIYNSINSVYFNIYNIFPDLTTINKNLIELMNFQNKMTNSSNFNNDYQNTLFTDLQGYYNDFDISRKFMYNSSLSFSKTFVYKLFTNLTIIQPNYSAISVSLNQILASISTYLGLLNDIKLVKTNNSDIMFILNNLNIDLYTSIIDLLNGSLDNTKDLISNLINTKKIFYLIIIILITGLGGFIYSHILCYYCEQNKMISLLLSIEEDSSREIIDSIRILKSNIFQKDNDVNIGEEKVEEEGINPEELQKEDDSKKEKSKIIGGKDMNGDRQKLEDNYDKLTKSKGKPFKSDYQISPKVYISLFSRIVLIICITLIPFIIGSSASFYDNKSLQIINLIQKSNVNQFYYILTFLNYQSLICNNDNLQKRIDDLNAVIENFQNNQFLTSDLLYQTLNGLSGTSSFNEYYDSNFCQYINTTFNSSYDCTNKNGAYSNYGFLYVMNINLNIIQQVLRNNDFTLIKNNSMIINYYSDPNYLLTEKTYDIMIKTGFKVFTDNIKISINSFISAYQNQFLIIFILNIICLIFNQLVSILFMRYIIRAVNFELKNIFSLMPYLIFLTNPNINNLLSK